MKRDLLTTPTALWEDIKFNAFTEDELALFYLFNEQVVQIFESSFIKNASFKSFLTITVNRTRGEVETTLDTTEEANIRSILILVRQLTRANDNTSIRIERILSILKHKSANNETRLYLQTLIQNFHNRKNTDTNPTIMIRGLKDYTEEDIIELWVNGYYFHKDGSKRKELDDLEHFMPNVDIKPLLKSILLHEIIDACSWAKLIDDILVNIILPKQYNQ